MAFLITGKEGAVSIHRHAVGRTKAIGNAPALGTVLAHLDNGTVVWNQPILCMAGGLGK